MYPDRPIGSRWRNAWLRRGMEVLLLAAVMGLTPLFCSAGRASTVPLPQQMANAVIQRWPGGHQSSNLAQWKWNYNLGTMLNIAAGRVAVSGNLPVFPGSHIFYMKDTCTISVHGAAVALVKKNENVMMATAEYGRGMVFAVVDPWVYNEYTDGHNRNLPAEYDNFSGAKDLVPWLVQQVPAR